MKLLTQVEETIRADTVDTCAGNMALTHQPASAQGRAVRKKLYE
jgi:hypothetical protein